MLIIFGGLPGVGKSTIAKKLAATLKAVYLRIDTIEQAIKDASKIGGQQIEVTAEGYIAACAIAKDNLELGLTVITDSVNPVEITRTQYRKTATDSNSRFFEVEIICSDRNKHKERVEMRSTSIPDFKLPSWQDVLSKEYETWQTKQLSIDTAHTTPQEAVNIIMSKIKLE